MGGGATTTLLQHILIVNKLYLTAWEEVTFVFLCLVLIILVITMVKSV